MFFLFFFFFKQKTAYEIRPCDWSSDVCSSDLTGQPRLGGTPIAQHGGLGYAEQLGAFRHVESPEEPALDHQCLTWLQPGERLEGGLETEQLIRAAGRLRDGVVEGGVSQSTAPLLRLPSPGGLDQDLAHGARGDPLEVQARDSGESW